MREGDDIRKEWMTILVVRGQIDRKRERERERQRERERERERKVREREWAERIWINIVSRNYLTIVKL